MKSPLRILHIEDDPNDVELIKSMLETDGLACKLMCVETKSDFIGAIEQENFDIIFSDCSLPSFDGMTALSIAREKCPDIPFIFVSGTLGEEPAIESLKHGATDYILKDRMSRLIPSVHRALREANERIERKKAEAAQRVSEEKYSNLFRYSNDGIFLLNLSSNIIDANQKILNQFGYKRSKFLAMRLSDLCPPGLTELLHTAVTNVFTEGFYSFEIDFMKKNGKVFPAEVSASLFKIQGRKVIQGIVRDLTERKRIEEMKREASELKRVKQLAGAIAHEFSQPLQILSNSLYLIKSDQDNSKKIDICHKMVHRSSTLVSQLREITSLKEKDYLSIKIIDLKASSQPEYKDEKKSCIDEKKNAEDQLNLEKGGV